MSFIFGVIDFENRCNIDLMLPESDSSGTERSCVYITNYAGLRHNHGINDPDIENCSMTLAVGERLYTVLYSGRIDNIAEVKRELKKDGTVLGSECTAKLLLYAYILMGERFAEKLDGDFVFCIYDEQGERLFAACGCGYKKRLFYAVTGTAFLFSSDEVAMKRCIASDDYVRMIKPSSSLYYDRDGLSLY